MRVANFHRSTVHNFVKLLAASGLEKPSQIRGSMINRRVSVREACRYDEIYPYLSLGCLLNDSTAPSSWELYLDEADAHSFVKNFQDLIVV